jgi:hypothetical protein
MVNDIERRKLLGRATQNDDNGNFNAIGSIGKFIEEERSAGRLNDDDIIQFRKLLEARLIGGDQNSSKNIRALRNTGYLFTIANPLSALVQISDLATTAMQTGILNTVGAAFRTIAGKNKANVVDLGIETAAKELGESGQDITTKMLNGALKFSVFRKMDRFLKNTNIEANLTKMQKQASTPQGRAELKRKFGRIFGDDMDIILSDLRTGEKNSQIYEMLFSQIADVQPVSKLDYPEVYNSSPDGRIFYMLKGFTLKQLDIVRNQIIGEVRKGNITEAAKNAAVLSSVYATLGAGIMSTKDFIKGKEVDPADVPDKMMWSVLGVLGLNEYAGGQLLGGDIGGFVGDQLAPPMVALEMLFKGVDALTEQDAESVEKLVGRMPVFGAYYQLMNTMTD